MNGDDNAFPTVIPAEQPMIIHHGLTIRELFAAMAMQGNLACSREPFGGYTSPQKLATHSIEAADALIDELKKPPTGPDA